MAAKKKNTDDFDEMNARSDSLRQKLKSEGDETNLAARNFRKIVIAWINLQMEMIVWLYQYVRANQAAQKEMDEEALLTGSNAVLELAIGSGTKAIPLVPSMNPGNNGGVREVAETARDDEVAVSGVVARK